MPRPVPSPAARLVFGWLEVEVAGAAEGEGDREEAAAEAAAVDAGALSPDSVEKCCYYSLTLKYWIRSL